MEETKTHWRSINSARGEKRRGEGGRMIGRLDPRRVCFVGRTEAWSNLYVHVDEQPILRPLPGLFEILDTSPRNPGHIFRTNELLPRYRLERMNACTVDVCESQSSIGINNVQVLLLAIRLCDARYAYRGLIRNFTRKDPRSIVILPLEQVLYKQNEIHLIR